MKNILLTFLFIMISILSVILTDFVIAGLFVFIICWGLNLVFSITTVLIATAVLLILQISTLIILGMGVKM